MPFTLLVIAACIIIYIMVYLMIKRTRISHKVIASILVCGVLVVPFVLTGGLPISNMLMRFPTPESAFMHINGHRATIEDVIEGEDSACILYRGFDELDEITTAIALREERGWCLASMYNIDMRLYTQEGIRASIVVECVKNTDDYYLSVLDTFTTDISVVTDNRGSEFRQMVEDAKWGDTIHVSHYAYVKNLDEGYVLNIDGVDIPIKIEQRCGRE